MFIVKSRNKAKTAICNQVAVIFCIKKDDPISEPSFSLFITITLLLDLQIIVFLRHCF